MNQSFSTDMGGEKEVEEEESSLQPHEGMFFVLTYLPVFELITMSQVCRALRNAVNNDILPWMNIVVQKPLNTRISDDIFIEITRKSSGRLRVLALMNCAKITDDGLLRVVSRNPYITKLYVPACTSLTPKGVIKAVKMLTRKDHRLTSLKINGIYHTTTEDLETLQSLILPEENQPQENQREKILYHEYQKFSTHTHKESNRAIDMEKCPRCRRIGMVFNCPGNFCKTKKQNNRLTECRGCDLCIPRCEECGKCITSQELEEAACAGTLCLDCWLQLPKCNYCNKPYCNQHAHQRCMLSGSSGFICVACHVKFTEDKSHSVE